MLDKIACGLFISAAARRLTHLILSSVITR